MLICLKCDLTERPSCHTPRHAVSQPWAAVDCSLPEGLHTDFKHKCLLWTLFWTPFFLHTLPPSSWALVCEYHEFSHAHWCSGGLFKNLPVGKAFVLFYTKGKHNFFFTAHGNVLPTAPEADHVLYIVFYHWWMCSEENILVTLVPQNLFDLQCWMELYFLMLFTSVNLFSNSTGKKNLSNLTGNLSEMSK